ncbi:LEUCINE-RICH REPEAT PROTEIN KINASE FAMILY PROTEIN [Salix purpurea]|uniref:LEUCINE-RICH REPEAT PROTEIN KINASE FAMILY PROTEIN n=1 Tax=Salix purpurea TaxID=77065 RepID=A0A9Q0VIY2_SALPP|nr:LEUCINE-RICH REPEAT PROTEIN KINASE FAMILY PROTEIN [Salix purpurea]
MGFPSSLKHLEIVGENGEGPKSRQMERLEDDVSSFGFILLESLVGPSVSARRDKLVPDELASCNSQEGRQKSLNPIVLATGSQESLMQFRSRQQQMVSSFDELYISCSENSLPPSLDP